MTSRRETLAFILCLLLNSLVLYLLAWPSRDMWVSIDEAIYACQAQRVLEGQVIYRDFFQFIGPLYLWILAAWMKLAGGDVPVLRLFMILIMLATSTLLYALARRLDVSRPFACVLSVSYSVLLSRSGYELNHYGLSMLLVVLTALCLCAFAASQRPVVLVLAGAAASAALLTTQNVGLYLLSACLLVLVCCSRTGRAELLKNGLLLAASCLPLPAAYLLYAHATRSLGAAYECTYAWVLNTYTHFATRDVPFHWLRSTWGRLVDAPDIRHLHDLLVAIVEAFAAPLAVAVAAALLWRAWRGGKKLDEPDRVLLAATIVAAVLYAGIYAVPNVLLARLSLPGYVLAYALACRAYGSWQAHPGGRARLRSALSVVGMLATLILVALPLRAASVFVHTLRRNLTERCLTLDTARGRVRLPLAADVGQSSVLAFLAQNAAPGSPIFAVNWSPWIYYLSGHRNPAGTEYLLPLFTDGRQVSEAIAALERSRTPWLIQDRVLQHYLDRKDGRFQDLNPALIENWEFNKYRDRVYEPVTALGEFTVYRRRPQVAGEPR